MGRLMWVGIGILVLLIIRNRKKIRNIRIPKGVKIKTKFLKIVTGKHLL